MGDGIRNNLMKKYPLTKKVRIIAFIFGIVLTTPLFLNFYAQIDISIWELLATIIASLFLIYASLKGESPIWAEDGPLIWWTKRKNSNKNNT